MRLYLSLIFGSLFFMHLKSQSFKIINSQDNTLVNANDVFYCAAVAAVETEQNYLIKNVSGLTQTLSVRKYEDQLNTVAPGDEAQAFFCTGAICYAASVNTASFVLLANDSMTLKASFQEASVAGESSIRYKISNPGVAESLQWTIKYTKTVSVKSNFSFSGFISEVYPNPSSSNAFISIKAPQNNNIVLSTFNYSGQLLDSKKINIAEGDNKIPITTESMAAGIYFISIRSGNAYVTKKFIVTANSN